MKRTLCTIMVVFALVLQGSAAVKETYQWGVRECLHGQGQILAGLELTKEQEGRLETLFAKSQSKVMKHYMGYLAKGHHCPVMALQGKKKGRELQERTKLDVFYLKGIYKDVAKVLKKDQRKGFLLSLKQAHGKVAKMKVS